MIEYTVHHEDVRRANGRGPRDDRDDLQREVWSKLRRLAGIIVSRAHIAPVGLDLTTTGVVEVEHAAGKGAQRVSVTGPPVELLLFLYGRQANAEVELVGEPADVAVATTANFGI